MMKITRLQKKSDILTETTYLEKINRLRSTYSRLVNNSESYKLVIRKISIFLN